MERERKGRGNEKKGVEEGRKRRGIGKEEVGKRGEIGRVRGG